MGCGASIAIIVISGKRLCCVARRYLSHIVVVIMGAVLDVFSRNKQGISPFKRNKLLHEFYTFFDTNKDGSLDAQDLRLAKARICRMSGLRPGDQKYQHFEELFHEMWKSLSNDADMDHDEKITVDEWINMWEGLEKQMARRSPSQVKRGFPSAIDADSPSTTLSSESEESPCLPSWLRAYLKYKFNLLDRTGDGIVDDEEFAYVLSLYDVPEKDAKRAWLIFTENNTKVVNFQYFCELAEDYFLSDDPAALGNFITGRLVFDDQTTR